MLRIVIITFLTGIVRLSGLFGQTSHNSLEKAEYVFAENSENSWKEALPEYLSLLKTDSSNQILNYKIGLCYLNSRSQKEKAITYLEKSIASGSASVNAYEFLGDAYRLTYQFDLAVSAYEKFKEKSLDNNLNDSAITRKINDKIEICKLGNKLKGLSVISENDEKYFEDPLQNVAGYPIKISPACVTDTIRNEATIATSENGQMILIYKDERGEGNLYVSGLNENQWTKPEKLNKPVNMGGWETNEFISADGYTLYFTSNREGGFGGKDIYKCEKMQNGEWSKATNLGSAINTQNDEEAPVIYPDGVTLFFSSNRNKTKCCFDVFTSTLLNERTWTDPVNIGYPPKGNPETGAIDQRNNYRTTFISTKEFPLTVIKGEITGLKNQEYPEITVAENTTGEISGIYYPNRGHYLFILPAGKSNIITFTARGHLFYSENINMSKEVGNYEERNPIQLPSITRGSSVFLNNLFFDSARTTLSPASYVELTNISFLLTNNPDRLIQISDYVYPGENNNCDKRFAQLRAQSITDYLIGKGIKKERIITKGYANTNLQKNKSNSVELKIIR